MKISEMSVIDCVDWLYKNTGMYSWCTSESQWINNQTGKGLQFEEPYPLTIEGATKAINLPYRSTNESKEFWMIRKIFFGEYGDTNWSVYILRMNDGVGNEYRTFGPDELTTRYRAAVISHIWPENKGNHRLQ